MSTRLSIFLRPWGIVSRGFSTSAAKFDKPAFPTLPDIPPTQSAPAKSTVTPTIKSILDISNSSLTRPANGPNGNGNAFDQVYRLARQARTRMDNITVAHQSLAERKVSEDYLRQMPRPWQAGDVYAPKDMSFSELTKWKRTRRRNKDIIDILGINPLDMYSNPTFLADFTSPFGQILHSRMTGLRPVNQRKVAKAIRRAIGLGLHPSVHRHPEQLRIDFAAGKNRS